MTFKNAQVIGFNTDQEAAQVLISYKGEDQVFIAVIKIVSDDAFTRGRHLLSELSDMFFENSEEGVGQKLTTVFAEAKQKLSDSSEFHILLGAISSKVLYLIHKGEINTLLKRQDKVSSLIEERPQEQLISGFLQEGDRVLFSTENMIKLLGEELKQSLSLPLTEWEEVTSTKMGIAETDSQGFACLLVEAQEPQEQITNSEQSNEIPTLNEDYTTKKNSFKNPLSNLNFGILLSTLGSIRHAGRLLPKSGKGRLFMGIVLLIVLLGGIAFQYFKNQENERTKIYAGFIEQANKDYDAALSLQTLNPTETKTKLASAKENVNKAIALKPTDKTGLDLKKKIEENEESVLQQFKASDLPAFLDLNTIKEDFKADHLSIVDGKLVVLDNTNKSLYTISIDKKDNSILTGESDLGDAVFSALSDSFAVVYSQDNGILKVDMSNKKVTTVTETDEDWGSVGDIGGFGSNVYLLDKTANQVWKFVPAAAGYSGKRPYFVASVKVDLSDAQRMQIDSSIYILKGDGTLLKFTKGAQDSFTFSGLDKPLSNPRSFFVSGDTESVYIIDSGNSRLVVTDKSGVYKTQYESDKFSAISDLVVDEKTKKVYLLEGSKIYELQLK